jgi:hypothetical protein
MEAWLKAQEVAITFPESTNLSRPSSAPLDPYTRSSLLMSAGSLSTPVSPVPNPVGASFSVTTAVAGDPNAAYSTPSSSPFRGSFLAGANQDLLGAGALVSCGILSSTLAGRYTLLGAKVGMPPAASLPDNLPDSVGSYTLGTSTPAAAGGSLSRTPVPLVRMS